MDGDKLISKGTQFSLVLNGSMAASATSAGVIILEWSTPFRSRFIGVSTQPTQRQSALIAGD